MNTYFLITGRNLQKFSKKFKESIIFKLLINSKILASCLLKISGKPPKK